MVAPNGAHLQKTNHPALPVTLEETIECAKLCYAAGARGLHLHLRDDAGEHLLDAGAYREALKALSAQCPNMFVQITTEAAGKYQPAAQRFVALNSGADYVSASVREICREPDEASGFYRACATSRIVIQHILYDVVDAQLLRSVLPPEQFTAESLQLIFVLGRYTENQTSDRHMLDPFLDWMVQENIQPDWAVCAFGSGETDCLLYAAEMGGKCRIGFENSLLMANGERALNNQQRVEELHGLLSKSKASFTVV